MAADGHVILGNFKLCPCQPVSKISSRSDQRIKRPRQTKIQTESKMAANGHDKNSDTECCGWLSRTRIWNMWVDRRKKSVKSKMAAEGHVFLGNIKFGPCKPVLKISSWSDQRVKSLRQTRRHTEVLIKKLKNKKYFFEKNNLSENYIFWPLGYE